jgi:hypothetical protein
MRVGAEPPCSPSGRDRQRGACRTPYAELGTVNCHSQTLCLGLQAAGICIRGSIKELQLLVEQT